jgi:parallel beta-helix repeat protein
MKNKILIIIMLSLLVLSTVQASQGLAEDLPSYFSWTDYKNIDYSTSIKDMGGIWGCEAFAIVAAMEAIAQIRLGFPFECDLSEAHLLFCSNLWNLNSGIEEGLNYAMTHGVPDEGCWPWPKKKGDYPHQNNWSNWEDRVMKITGWDWIDNDIDSIKEALITYGPVIAHMETYRDFLFYQGGVYSYKWGKNLEGSHWITIFGYKDDADVRGGGYWIAKNSYGKDWGENGWLNIKYGECGVEKHAIYIENIAGVLPIKIIDYENENGPWDGSKEYPYNKIQDGINNSYNSYSIYIKNGVYVENIYVDKTLKIIGEEKNTTIINGNNTKNVIYVNSENVTIMDITIENSGNNTFDSGIFVRKDNANFNLINTEIKNTNIGLYLSWSNNNKVLDNKICNSTDGIYLWNSYNNMIKNNFIYNCTDTGIKGDSSQSMIYSNTIIGCNIGIKMEGKSNRNFIFENFIKNNLIGIRFKNSRRNLIIRNNLIKNEKQIEIINSYDNHWFRNHWSDWKIFIPRPIKCYFRDSKIPLIRFDMFPSMSENSI